MEDVNKLLKEFTTSLTQIRMDLPETMDAFFKLSRTVHKEGALLTKEKELICLGISISRGCKTCIIHHTKAALEAGAAKEEIMDACAVAIFMGGAPAVTYVRLVIESMEKWSK